MLIKRSKKRIIIGEKTVLQATAMDHKILFGFIITFLLTLNGHVLADQDEDIPHNE